MHLAIFAVSCLIGQLIQTTTGFGFAIVVMAVASTLFPVTTLTASCTLMALASCGLLGFRYRKNLRFRTILWPLAAFLVTSSAAIFSSRFISTQTLRGFLGIALMGLSAFFLYFRKRICIRPTTRNGLIVGSASGILSGYFSTGGPPTVLYLLCVSENKEEYLAGIQAFFFFSNIANLIGRALAGYYTMEVFQMTLLGYVGVALGMLLGLKLVHLLNIEKLRTVTYGFIGISGFWIALSTFVL